MKLILHCLALIFLVADAKGQIALKAAGLTPEMLTCIESIASSTPFSSLKIQRLVAPTSTNENWQKMEVILNLKDPAEIKYSWVEFIDSNQVIDPLKIDLSIIKYRSGWLSNKQGVFNFNNSTKKWIKQSNPEIHNATVAILITEAFLPTNPIIKQLTAYYERKLKALNVDNQPDQVADVLDNLKSLAPRKTDIPYDISDGINHNTNFKILPSGLISEWNLKEGGRTLILYTTSFGVKYDFSIKPDDIGQPIDVLALQKEFLVTEAKALPNSKGYGLIFGIENAHFLIIGILPNSPASAANIKIGDTVEKINGLSLKGLSLQDIKHLADRDSITLTLRSKDLVNDISLKRATIVP